MRRAGLNPSELQVREIRSERQAQAERFAGSPTIRVDGHDVQPPPAGEPPALTCRVYRLRDGRPSPTPDRADLDDALRATVRGQGSGVSAAVGQPAPTARLPDTGGATHSLGPAEGEAATVIVFTLQPLPLRAGLARPAGRCRPRLPATAPCAS